MNTPRAGWSLEGKAFVVTGGSKGIGKAVVDALLSHSAGTVVFCSRSALEDGVLSEMKAKHPSASIHHIICDVSTSEGRLALLNGLGSAGVSKVHGLVNNVGVNVRKKFTEQSEADYQTIMRTNVDSAYFLCQHLLPLLRAAENAAIVNVSSAAGVQSSGTGAAYGMSKAALNQLTRILACEWAARYGIRVNAVAPWMTMTPLLEQAIQDNPAQLDKVKAWTPLHRLAEAAEIAAPVVFLLMPCASYITGQVLGVDGGLTAQGYDGPCVTKEDA